MRTDSLPARIIQLARQRQAILIHRAELVGAGLRPRAVNRALARLVAAYQIERIGRGIYRVLPNQPPALAFDRAWSNPGASFPPDKLIAVTLARPTFRDVARLCKAYGVSRVRQGLERLVASGAISDAQAAEWRHRLGNIERGFADAVNCPL